MHATGRVTLWDASGGRKGEANHPESASANTACVDGAGRHVHVGFDDGTIRSYRLPSLELAASWKGHDASVHAIAELSDGRLVTAGGAWIRLWGGPGKLRTIMREHRSWVLDLAVADDESWLVSAGNDAFAVLWGLEGKGQVVEVRHDWPICTLALSGRRVVSGDLGGFAAVWDPRAESIEQRFRAHDKLPVAGVALDGPSRLYSVARGFRSGVQRVPGTEGWLLKAWDLSEGAAKQLDAIPVDGGPTCLLRVGDTLWVGCRDSTIRRYVVRPRD